MFQCKKLLLTGLFVSSLAFTGLSHAVPTSQPIDATPSTQPADKKDGDKKDGDKHRPPQVDRLSKQIDQLTGVTDDQRKQIAPMLDKLESSLDAINKDTTVPVADKKDKTTEAMKSAMQDIKGVLTADQVTQLKSLRGGNDAGGGKGKGGKKKKAD